MILRKNITVIIFAQSRVQRRVRSAFRSSSQNLKILAIHNLLAHWKLYGHGFTNKRDSHKLCTKLSFNQFFTHQLGITKYWPVPTY
ncbi:hypothetical protein B296_00045377 [Ensete ventricosum]|uniref:Uncharacterized protein n=1 Tax=Ensete ventricosum TaxID=4639 RepID=A0A426Z7R8_ENSVE|nr:hypothetical protein B296_00045377 [Ensete ventricosum]